MKATNKCQYCGKRYKLPGLLKYGGSIETFDDFLRIDYFCRSCCIKLESVKATIDVILREVNPEGERVSLEEALKAVLFLSDLEKKYVELISKNSKNDN